jgi:uncharacterized membrane protein YciS (DUF1049 family)
VAVLLLLLASIGGVVVDGLVLENSAAGTVTVLDHSFTGYRQGQLLAMAAGVGLVLGLLVVGSLSLRRTRRARRRQLRRTERELRGQLLELQRENSGLRDELARRDSAARRVAGVSAAASLEPPAAARTVRPPLADHPAEPIYEEARRVARLRSSAELSLLSTHR